MNQKDQGKMDDPAVSNNNRSASAAGELFSEYYDKFLDFKSKGFRDTEEIEEWISAFDGFLKHRGSEESRELLKLLSDFFSTVKGGQLADTVYTPYCNTIPTEDEPEYPGDLQIERRIRAVIRWNALAMVVRTNLRFPELGGHISSFASGANLYDVGFNHFFRAPKGEFLGDLIYVQGHSSPGIYSRSYLEGRLSESHLDKYRQEVNKGGLSSYPHPWLMPNYWQFATVSMGLGPIMSIYQAHLMKYLSNRRLLPDQDRKVWMFLGDGETDEPETLGVISLAGREKLDNLIFVVNCNLQRLDGPVRGNGKIIQELEGQFRGAGWNVIKVVWSSDWDPLLKHKYGPLLLKHMNETVDGEYQNFKAKGGAYVREAFFSKSPELREIVEDLTDEEILKLKRGGHDSVKLYAAYKAATTHKGQPTVILAKTVKGYGMGEAGESENNVHQVKKLSIDQLKAFRDRFRIPVSDEELEDIPYYHPGKDSPELQYLRKCREDLGGYLPQRNAEIESLPVPPLEVFQSLLQGSGKREASTTMVFVRFLSTLLRDKKLKERIVPIVPDEARTFGMEGMFSQLGIYSSEGQRYQPVDSSQLTAYYESKDGQVLEEGINEAGAFSAWIAAGTSYSTNGYSLIPFYIYYSMFGFQRIGDLAWAAGDMQARGFLIGAIAGRTSLSGEGLQHQDGHSHILAGTIPNCISYDVTYGYEMAVILQHGMEEMFAKGRKVFYYITVSNETYPHPKIPSMNLTSGIIKGMYPLTLSETHSLNLESKHVRLLGSGGILREVIAASEILKDDFGITSTIWGVTSFNELAREGHDIIRSNTLASRKPGKLSYVEQCLGDSQAPVIAATDYMKIYADQIRAFIKAPYYVLGTDGFGRSDTREKLRDYFEVNRYFIVITVLYALMEHGEFTSQELSSVCEKYGLNELKPNPREN